MPWPWPSARRRHHGPDANAIFGGGGLTNEKAYQLGKFARVALGTSRIDYNGRFCMSSAAAASNRAFGMDRGLPFPVTDLDDAATILLLGSNVAATMPPFLAHLAGARAARAHRRRPAPLGHRAPHRRRRRHAPAGGSRNRPSAPARPHAHRDRRGSRRPCLFRGRTSGFDALRRSVAPVVARADGIHHRSPRRRPPSHRASPRRGTRVHPHRTRRRTARRRHRHRDRRDQPRPRTRSRRGRGLGLRHADGPGQRPGRTRARPEGRPAPGYRSIRDPDARRHVAGSGASIPTRSRMPASRPPPCSANSAGRQDAAGRGLERRRLGTRRRRRARAAERPRHPDRLRLLPLETAELADIVLRCCSGPKRRAR